MKQLTLFACLFLLLFASCKSKEEKANELIKQQMFKTLYDFESYEPIETVIDSAFTALYRDTSAMVLALLLKENQEEMTEYIANVKTAQRKMDIWSDGRYSYGRKEYQEALEEAKENLELAQAAMDVRKLYKEQIKAIAEEFTPEFIGWEATHRFRCKNKGGNFAIGTYRYIFDKDMKNILYKEDMEDEDVMEIKVQIELALSDDDEDDDNEEDEE